MVRLSLTSALLPRGVYLMIPGISFLIISFIFWSGILLKLAGALIKKDKASAPAPENPESEKPEPEKLEPSTLSYQKDPRAEQADRLIDVLRHILEEKIQSSPHRICCKCLIATDPETEVIYNTLVYCKKCFKRLTPQGDHTETDALRKKRNSIEMSYADALRTVPGFPDNTYLMAEYQGKRYLALIGGSQAVRLFIRDDLKDVFEVSCAELDNLFEFEFDFVYNGSPHKSLAHSEKTVKLLPNPRDKEYLSENGLLEVDFSKIDAVICHKVSIIDNI